MAAIRRRRAEHDDPALIRAITAAALPVTTDRDLDRLLAPIGDRRFVFIGEASHGSHEFYALRAALTRRLITDHGFHAVAVEGDWPDAYRVDRYVRGTGTDQTAVEALDGFRRFPSWMWRNADVLDFVGWLRDRNDDVGPADRAGFYGLDLYCLRDSATQVLAYLDRTDPEAAARARERYACFDHGSDAETFGAQAHLGLRSDCEQELVEQLVELRRRRMAALGEGGLDADDAHFHAEQNARVVTSAARYYRTMFSQRISSWNVRDRHMADTLDALAGHLSGRNGVLSRIVVWAHNSHVGDARATDMGDQGEVTIGQLARERHPGQVALIGMTTHTGSVTAASDWGGPAERKAVRESLAGSSERLFHDCALPRFGLWLAGDDLGGLAGRRLQRAIGVIYRPDTERASHYLHGELAAQYDAVIHLDVTHALEPLERQAPAGAEVAETFPTGI
jgi:erythromycin esterase-like protein